MPSSVSLSVADGEAEPLGEDVLVEPEVLVDVGLDVALPPSAFFRTSLMRSSSSF